MPALTFAALDWQSAAMPGSNGPVELARLPSMDDNAFRAFVRFPAGWARPGAGHYAVPEEFLVLEGGLSLDGRTWHAGGYAWIQAGRVRTGSRSTAGCLAFAWFGGPPRWVVGDAAAPATDVDLQLAHWRDAPLSDLGDGLHARVLRAGTEHSTWVVEEAALGKLAKLGAACEALSLVDHTWTWNEPADATASRGGALLVRTRSDFALRE